VARHQIPYRAPLARAALLGFLAFRATPGVEEVSDDRYRRVVSIDGHRGVVEARLPGDRDVVELELDDALEPVANQVLEGARRVFDVAAEPVAIDAVLAADVRLQPLVEQLPGLRVPGAIDGFEIAVRAILGQQISVVAARTITARLATLVGQPLAAPDGGLRVAFPEAEAVATRPLDGLGVPASRAATLVGVAQAICDGRLDLSPTADRDAAREALLAIRGVGPWTAGYVALRALGDTDAFLASDLVIRQVLGDAAAPVSAREAERLSQCWRPCRAYALVHLWTSAPAVRLARAAR
jgi:AraC family transcriptional regulator of adaptative response / DNA-3-methyladenine glycosylase II